MESAHTRSSYVRAPENRSDAKNPTATKHSAPNVQGILHICWQIIPRQPALYRGMLIGCNSESGICLLVRFTAPLTPQLSPWLPWHVPDTLSIGIQKPLDIQQCAYRTKNTTDQGLPFLNTQIPSFSLDLALNYVSANTMSYQSIIGAFSVYLLIWTHTRIQYTSTYTEGAGRGRGGGGGDKVG